MKSKTKLHIKTGDTVKVIAGNEKGKSGTVKQVLTTKDRVIIEGLNIVKKHIKPSATNPNGGIENVEAGIHISNLQLVDPKSGETTRVGKKVVDGKLQRFSKKSGEVI